MMREVSDRPACSPQISNGASARTHRRASSRRACAAGELLSPFVVLYVRVLFEARNSAATPRNQHETPTQKTAIVTKRLRNAVYCLKMRVDRAARAATREVHSDKTGRKAPSQSVGQQRSRCSEFGIRLSSLLTERNQTCASKSRTTPFC